MEHIDAGAATDARLPTETWLKAGLRLAAARGTPGYVLRRGGVTGLVILQLWRGEAGTAVHYQERDFSTGRLGWAAAMDGRLVPADQVRAYVDRRLKADPDLWVVELESPDGWMPFS